MAVGCDTVRDYGSADMKMDCGTVAEVLKATACEMSKGREGAYAERGNSPDLQERYNRFQIPYSTLSYNFICCLSLTKPMETIVHHGLSKF